MKSKKKETVGKISQDAFSKQSGFVSPLEIWKEAEKDYLDNLIWCVNHAIGKVDCSTMENHDTCKDNPSFDSDFFVVVLIKKEKLLQNVMRNYFIATLTCPTPTHDQSVFYYNHDKESLEFLWAVPDQETCLTFIENKNEVVMEERQLLQNILDFYDGNLYKLAKRLNGEASAPGVALQA